MRDCNEGCRLGGANKGQLDLHNKQNRENSNMPEIIPSKKDLNLIEEAKQLRKHQTPAEETLWQAIRKHQLGGYKFRRQEIIGPFIVDFYNHQNGLIIEVDGGIHLQQQEYDAARTEWLEAHGYVVIRFMNDEVLLHLDKVIEKIIQCLEKIE